MSVAVKSLLADDKFISKKCTQHEIDFLIAELRKKVEATRMPGSIVPRTDSTFLARFIRVKDFSVDDAFKKFKKYYESVNRHMDYHLGIRPSQYTSLYNSKYLGLLKHRFDMVGVAVCRLRYWKPKETSLLDNQRALLLFSEQVLDQIDIQENGVSTIIDLDGLRLEHLKLPGIRDIRRLVDVSQDALPVRNVSIHILNAPKIFWPIFQIAKRFMKAKMRQRIHFHDNLESLHMCFNKEILPECLGGNLSEEKASERYLIEKMLKEDLPYEQYWNGALWEPNGEQTIIECHKEGTKSG